ncbi:MAG: BatD family protein [Prevotella sp.]|nr:BatD family protein [Prevotella sp.]
MKRLFLFLSFLILNIVAALAQHITANAPQQVATGQQFRLQYSIDTQDISDFSMGQVPDAFEVLMGPSRSTSSSFQIINGKTSQSSSTTLTYILVANKNGTFTLPSASVTADGKKISSNTVKIVVSGQAQGQNNGGGSGSGNSRQHRDAQEQDMGKNISGNELFIRVSANKKRVYEQEPILLTYKVYSLVNLTQLEGKMPDLKGFHTQEVPLPQQKSFSLEQFNGRNYNTVTWSQYVMFPQITGKLQIPSLTFNGIVAMRNRYVDPFEAFFNGGSGYVEVKKSIKAPGIDIEVEPLPERPANFSGGVGKFSISATVDKTEVKANDPINMKVVVSGVGNLKLIKEPVVEFPKDFDRYDAKQTDKTKLTTNGLEGSMVYEFLTVPRHQGEFDIPPVEFVFFNTATRKYETVKTEAFHIHVEKGDGSEVNTMRDYSSQEEVQTLAKDIRYIKLGDVKQKQVGSFFFGSGIYWAVMGVLLAIFVALFVIFRQRAIANADVVGSRAGKANKVATKRLKKAAKLMNDNKSNEFFDEVLRAMWGYVGDKLNIPVAKLNRDNIRERFDERGAEPEAVNAFVEILDMCEYQRYAPGDPRGNMSKVYKEAVSVIEKLESMMKKNKKKLSDNVFKSVMLIVASSFLSLMPSSADAEGVETGVTKAMADSAYASGNYQQAVVLYDSLLKSGVSFELYYNLGNAYYRTEDNTRAILNYERALMLSPSDADVRFNLQMARSKTIDKILPESEMFFVTWYRSLINMASVDGWAYFALTMLGLALVLVLLYLFADMLLLRKIGFFGAIVALLLFVFGNVFAWQQKHMMDTQRGAIIMESAVSVKSTPAANGTDLFILHEGTKVTIVDDSMREWKEVRVSDGKQGWIKTQQIEMI